MPQIATPPRTTRRRKSSKSPPSPVAYKEPSPRERIAYQIDDMAHQMTREHPRVKQIHAGIKDKLDKLADKTMQGRGAMYKDGDKDEMPMGKKKPKRMAKKPKKMATKGGKKGKMYMEK